ncbi:MAG: hypothetical protein UU48_C0008G0002 [Candidatus Uhrbacteria bacterium GW2011_GWF2_41_16]|uniref:Leucine-rich repeat domain-containing protein n=2 Tax=Candidatus Uhriibacteriota TaxID=1752732 RepID=A0A0G0V9V6_9BACT|nr:MAG: hypothetical protein UU35_C0014G0035 [Candidatus Uhrbacteria bacterium GW2011_GWC2_41_11]KKR97793.1 MAG: hypothetical protein UU48_C0008G0002 [Candidatus Uhrbacteria bacterium GW2011_GWF2_41_16]
MSPNSLENPFYHPEPNKGIPSELTGRFLDSATTQALTEALGEDEPCESEPQQDLPPADISMTGKEQREVEKEPLWIKEDYIKWAESFERDKNWVDKTFEFQKDGTTIVEGDLILEKTEIKQLPVGLMEVKGDFRVSKNLSFKLNGYPKKIGGYFVCNYNNLSSLEGMSEEIRRDIYLNDNKIRSLDGLPEKVVGDLYLSHNQLENLDGISKEVFYDLSLTDNNQLTSLEALKGVKIGGNLWLCDIPATTIPAGIEIVGVIYIREYQTELIADATRKGYQVES